MALKALARSFMHCDLGSSDLEQKTLSTTRSGRGCHPCLGYDPSPMCPGWTKKNFGAGEGIRTLDPDLGKVVLYP